MRRYLVVILISILLLSIFTTMYTFLSIALSILVLYTLIDKFGKGITLLETMSLYACIIYLIMPLLGYAIYNRNSRIAVLWAKQMPVSYETYYGYILPAICAYLIGLFFINYVKGRPDEGEKLNVFIEKAKVPVQSKNAGVILISVGIVFYFIKLVIPGPIASIASFGYLLVFAGLLYLHFQSKFKGRIWIYLLVGLFFVRDALNTGMFTVFFYMGITIISFFLVGRKIRFPVKLLTVAGAICGLFILQLVKGSFRKSTWNGNFTGSRVELFQRLFFEKASGFNEIFSENSFFPIYARLNQGFMTGLVMKRIPARQPFDGGGPILETVAASMVPRVLWPDKPQSGGVYNMQHYAAFTLRGWSTNVGPVGEAYGNFGVGGGVVYMFFFGLFIGWAYNKVFSMARRNPILILWIPLLFFEAMYAMENDTLQAMNSLIKMSIFIWIIYKLFPKIFIPGKKINTAANENSHNIRGNRAGWSLPR